MEYSTRRLREFLRLAVEDVVAERRRRTRSKPGGPRTDLGALRQLDHGSFAAAVTSAVTSTKGDVDDAARRLDVSPRTLYHYLDTDSSLGGVETSSELEDAEERKSDRS